MVWKYEKQYTRIRVNGKRMFEHRWVMEQHLGRTLNPNEGIDHINGNKKDNRIENLRIISRSEHAKMHYDQGDYKNMFSKESLDKLRAFHKSKRLPHTKNEFTCVRCRKMKHKNDFHVNSNRWNGLSSSCKECKKWYKKNKGR